MLPPFTRDGEDEQEKEAVASDENWECYRLLPGMARMNKKKRR